MRLLIFAVLLILLSVILVHNLPAPFPSPGVVLDTPYGALLRELGPPADFDPNSKLPTPINQICRLDKAVANRSLDFASGLQIDALRPPGTSRWRF